MKNICLVLGYGVFTPPNPEYQDYIEKAHHLCSQVGASTIFVCGGYTSKDFPDISEAASIAKLFPQETALPIIREEKSLSTVENLEFTKNQIELMGETPERITVICDSIRVPKVFYLSLILFSNILDFQLSEEDRLKILLEIFLDQDPNLIRNVTFSYKNLEVIGIPLSKSPEIISAQIISSMWEIHALDYPELHQDFLNWRKKKWGIS